MITHEKNIGFDFNIVSLYNGAKGDFVWFMSDVDFYSLRDILGLLDFLASLRKNNSIDWQSCKVLAPVNFPINSNIYPLFLRDLINSLNQQVPSVVSLEDEDMRLFNALATSQISRTIIRRCPLVGKEIYNWILACSNRSGIGASGIPQTALYLSSSLESSSLAVFAALSNPISRPEINGKSEWFFNSTFTGQQLVWKDGYNRFMFSKIKGVLVSDFLVYFGREMKRSCLMSAKRKMLSRLILTAKSEFMFKTRIQARLFKAILALDC